MKIKSTNESGYIRGSTVIDHRKRVKLGLTLQQYVFLDIIEQLILKHGKFNALSMQDDFYRLSGIDPIGFKSIGKVMMEKNFIVKVDKNIYVPFKAWGLSLGDYKKEFEVLWELYGKVGNRKTGEQMYIKARKAKFEYNFLLERVKVYLKFLKESGQLQLHASSFFNPTNEQFNNEFKAVKQEKKGGYNEQNEVYEGKF